MPSAGYACHLSKGCCEEVEEELFSTNFNEKSLLLLLVKSNLFGAAVSMCLSRERFAEKRPTELFASRRSTSYEGLGRRSENLYPRLLAEEVEEEEEEVGRLAS